MAGRDGLCKTGETYLVGQDKLMRSDSFLDPANHSVTASFKNPSEGSEDTKAASEALAGRIGTGIITDYNGSQVLSSFAPLKIKDLTWAIIAEMDVSEAFCPKDESGTFFFQKYAEKYGYYDLFLMNPNGYCFYSVAQEADYQTNLADGKYSSSNLGQLTRQVLQTKQFGLSDFHPFEPSNEEPAAFIAQPVLYKGEVELIVALQLPLNAINSIMQQRKGLGETGSAQVASAADQVSQSSQSMAEGAGEQAASLEETTAAMQEMGATTQENASNISETSTLAETVTNSTNSGRQAMGRMKEGIDEINKAMVQIDQVTQSNAASAEETASASEEMSAQARDMDEMVWELVQIVRGPGAGTISKQEVPSKSWHQKLDPRQSTETSGEPTQKPTNPMQKLSYVSKHMETINGSPFANRVIPLPEEELINI